MKRRGRPSNKTVRLTRIDSIRIKLKALIDGSIYHCTNFDGKLNILSRRYGILPKEIKKFKYNDMLEIKSLLDKYWSEKNAMESANEHRETKLQCTEDHLEIEEEEEEENDDINFIFGHKTSRSQYLDRKQPIQNYCEGSFQLLNSISQAILNEKNDEIFNSNKKYQEQIELVISSIYNPTKGSNSGPSAIGKLFGVKAGTISSHFKRMNRERNDLIGRPPDLNCIQIHMLIDYIMKCYIEKNPPTMDHLVNYVFNNFNVAVRDDSLRNTISKIIKLKSVIAQPLDEKKI